MNVVYQFLQTFLLRIIELFQKVGWVEIIDILVVAVVLYQLLKLVQGTRAVELMVGLVLLVFVGLVAGALNLVLLGWLFRNAAPFIVIAIIVLFQTELRRALDQVGRLSHINIQLTPFDQTLFNRGVAEAIRAIERLAARKTGALIVFEREVGLEDYAATGIRINGELTAEFLQTIFFPNSPLHDGAVIVRGNSIVSAGCLLPLPEEGRVRERLGTRHRAAIGLSMVSDAIVVVVSEETGAISAVQDGVINRNLDTDKLRTLLIGGLPAKKRSDGRSRRVLRQTGRLAEVMRWRG
ncbi:MAG: TIGR00159 family protein [Chloroflexi bacterium]|nr:MAG: TIGR00159 family protein [Chloroflexota bacterium]TME18082.1 MAG: TIGR00159 family protein [Chloroflexota bacterium]